MLWYFDKDGVLHLADDDDLTPQGTVEVEIDGKPYTPEKHWSNLMDVPSQGEGYPLVIEFDSFEKWFKPKRNPFDTNSGPEDFQGYTLGKHGEEWEFVKQHDNDHIWSVIIDDDQCECDHESDEYEQWGCQCDFHWWIVPGIHVVNRDSFMVCERPLERDDVEIRY